MCGFFLAGLYAFCWVGLCCFWFLFCFCFCFCFFVVFLGGRDLEDKERNGEEQRIMEKKETDNQRHKNKGDWVVI